MNLPCLEISNLPDLDFAGNEAFNVLATNISCYGSEIKTILVTSRYKKEGKTFVSMNLLRTLASLQKRVVLVDADLRQAQIMHKQGVHSEEDSRYGLAQYLAGKCGMERIVYQTNIPNTWIVPIGQAVHNSLQHLSSGRTRELMDDLRKRFDLVIVDAPSVGGRADAIEMAKLCDGALIVVGYNRGKRKDIGEAAEAIDKTGCRVLGSVLNNVDFRAFICRRHYYKSEQYAVYYQKDDDGSELSREQIREGF